MQIGDRAAAGRGGARARSRRRRPKLPDLELRTITVPEGGDAGTRLFAAIDRALADIPRVAPRRHHRASPTGRSTTCPKAAPGGAPLHVLIPAKGEETDRRLRVIEAPGYGIVGKR